MAKTRKAVKKANIKDGESASYDPIDSEIR